MFQHSAFLDFPEYLWTHAGIALLVFSAGSVVDYCGLKLESRIRNCLEKAPQSALAGDEFEDHHTTDDFCERYIRNLDQWNARTNVLILPGHAMIVFSGFLLLGLLGLLLFAVIDSSSFTAIIRRPDIRDRIEWSKQEASS